jgi:antitoxin (DNA-binding transcriptional repressor) of toxin-antitoxin stability system
VRFVVELRIAEKILDQVDQIDHNKNMKTLQVAEAKTHFSTVLKDIEAGNEIAISYGKKKKTIAVIIPYETWKKTKKRELGTLKGQGSVEFAEDWYMTDEELSFS